MSKPFALPLAGRSTATTWVVALLVVLAVGGTVGVYLWARGSDDGESDRVAQQLKEHLRADVLARSSGQDSPSLLERVQQLPSVDEAVPLIESDGQIFGSDGPLGGDDGAAVVANWIIHDQLSPYSIVEGRAPEDPYEVVIDRRTARESGLSMGDTIVIALPSTTEPVSFTISGIASLGPLDDDCNVPYVFLAPNARELARAARADASVGVLAVASPGVYSTELVAEAGSLPGIEVLDLDALVADRMQRCR